MRNALRHVTTVDGARPDALPPQACEPESPVVLRGLAAEWPVVQAARRSDADALAYLRRFYVDATVNAVRLPALHDGRVFYNEDMSGFNFEPLRAPLGDVLDELEGYGGDAGAPTLYVGSTTVDTCLPGFRAENDLSVPGQNPLVSIWLGNRSRVAAHCDLPDNIACCVAGRRRVLLFPPEQIDNLYIGPLDFNPAGQAISLVDIENPDFDRFPRFAEALDHAQVAELEPGDALVLPSMWWHHVEALGAFNVLINYWWRRAAAWMDSPANVLEYALLAIRDLPEAQRQAWRAWFDRYVFDFDESKIAHIPAELRGVLGPIGALEARQLRAKLLRKLNR